LARAVVDVLRERLSLLPIIFYDYLKAGVWRTFRTLHLLVRDPVEERLPNLAVPTLVVRGEHDMIVPEAWVEEIVRLVPQGQLAVIPGGAHAVHYGAAATLADVVRAFVATCSAST
jgi:pimeloyl-ACP methyl ester carboxylesterase